jgi:hypothetical protein
MHGALWPSSGGIGAAAGCWTWAAVGGFFFRRPGVRVGM